MARSMTGFGHAVVSKDGRELSIELKSVNHRFLDLALRMPRSLAFLEDTARNLSLIHISEPTRHSAISRMPSSA